MRVWTKLRIFDILVISCLVFPPEVAPYSYTGERSIRLSVLNSVTHDRMARPADLTNATVGFTLLVINDLDILTQQFEISGWFTVLWNDERLTWPPQNNDDTFYIHALEEEIWKPEVLIANAQRDIGLISDDHLIYRIDYLGNVDWEPVVSSVTNCAIDVTYYPFDTQTCTLKLLSWGLPSSELSLLKLWDEVNMNSFLGHSVWSVQQTMVNNSLVTETINNVTESYSQLEFTFVLKRNPGNYVINTLIPVVISSSVMVFVNLVPIASGERLTAAFLTLVMDAILFMTFTSHIPDIETTTSLLGFYVTFGFSLDLIWVITSIINTNIHYKNPRKPVPRLIKFLIMILKFCTLYFDPPQPSPPPVEPPPRPISTSVPTDDLLKIARETHDDFNTSEKTENIKRNSVMPEGFTEHTKALPPIKTNLSKHRTLDKLDSLSEKGSVEVDFRTNTHARDIYMTWPIVAAVLDRVLFVLFLVVKLLYNLLFIQRITNES